MKRRFTPVLAWVLWALIVVNLVLSAYLFGAIHHLDASGAITLLAFCGFATVGALVVAYRPGNTIGWLFLAVGIGTGFTAVSGAYVQYSAATGAQLPLAPTLDWLGNVIWPLNLCLASFILLLFPDGHLPSLRWRPLAWVLGLGALAACLAGAFTPGAFSGETTINPYGIPALAAPLTILGEVSGLLLIPCAALAVVAIISRFWRAKGIQREQLKWVAYAAALMALCIAIGAFAFQSDIGFSVGFCLLPLGAGIAILRNGLYDIDVLINRTLVYGSLTAVLAAVYFGVVIGLQALMQALTGQTQPQPVIIVASTLLIAALFNPLRRRLQTTIDRRFFRSRYDGARTLERFAATLRRDVDLYELRDHLITVVEETMQPAHVSLWLRPDLHSVGGTR